MAIRTEFEDWADERARIATGRKGTTLGHVIAAFVGIALAVFVIALEGRLL